MTASVVSLQTGRVARLEYGAGHVPSGIRKQSLAGRCALTVAGLDGDEHGDAVNHGGPDKAVCGYPREHYPYWSSRLARPLEAGAFGENFTLHALTEAEACIGDTYLVGSAMIQVSQPRQPCWKLARRWRIKVLTAMVEQTGRTGWYLRVLEEGEVEAGQPMTLLERPHPEWTVTRATRTMRTRNQDRLAAGQLALIEELAISWREHLAVAALNT